MCQATIHRLVFSSSSGLGEGMPSRFQGIDLPGWTIASRRIPASNAIASTHPRAHIGNKRSIGNCRCLWDQIARDEKMASTLQ
jgi:hypothetical protein